MRSIVLPRMRDRACGPAAVRGVPAESDGGVAATSGRAFATSDAAGWRAVDFVGYLFGSGGRGVGVFGGDRAGGMAESVNSAGVGTGRRPKPASSGALQLLEDAVHLFRAVPFPTLAWHWVG